MIKTSRLSSRLLYGDDSLSNQDLISVLLGSTSVAEQLVSSYGTLSRIKEASVPELRTLGICNSQIAKLKAAEILTKRASIEGINQGINRGNKLSSAQEVFAAILPLFSGENQEVFLILPLDAKHRLLSPPVEISRGSLIATIVHPR